MRAGIFFLLAGPSGAGKSTVLEQLVRGDAGLRKDISVTTRPPRGEEADGREYHFWKPEQFKAGLESGAFLEHAVVHGNRYGTLAAGVSAFLDQGLDVVKDMDVQGVAQVRAVWPYPRSVAIFITPPSAELLRQRLLGRNTEDPEAVQRRLSTAAREVERIGEFDYWMVNNALEEAVATLRAIVRAERHRTARLQEVFREAWSGKI